MSTDTSTNKLIKNHTKIKELHEEIGKLLNYDSKEVNKLDIHIIRSIFEKFRLSQKDLNIHLDIRRKLIDNSSDRELDEYRIWVNQH